MSDKPIVLIVEDNPINALVLGKMLQKFCQTDHVLNDEQVFKAVAEKSYQMILMDINLGGNSLDGEAIMKILKADEQHQHIPIFAVTSYAMSGDKERFLQAGFDGYFPKPVNRDKLIQRVREVLQLVEL
jgi:two-component system cell cycle response regulator DivK